MEYSRRPLEDMLQLICGSPPPNKVFTISLKFITKTLPRKPFLELSY